MQTSAPTHTDNLSSDRRVYLTPRADIHGNADGTTVVLDIPGVTNEGLEITVEDQLLTITGHRKNAAPSGEAFHTEIRPFDYRRVFELAPSIDTSKVTADLRNGVLHLRLPTAEKVKPRRITVS